MIIDTHTHIYPTLDEALKLAGVDVEIPNIKLLKKLAKITQGPQSKVNKLLQSASPLLRALPKELLPYADKIHAALSMGTTIANSSTKDLLESMDRNGVEKALVIAHPPLIPNDFVLETCAKNERLYPVVNIPTKARAPQELLFKYLDQGAVALKIHAAADGLESSSKHYQALLEVANERELPVIIHTGCIHIKPFYKEPEMGHAHKFVEWFDRYPKINFILAHMNYHHPLKAIEYCERFANVYCDCSWQPAEVISKAVERIPKKIMFGTDWPLVGSNQEVMLERVRAAKLGTDHEAALFHETAMNLFRL